MKGGNGMYVIRSRSLGSSVKRMDDEKEQNGIFVGKQRCAIYWLEIIRRKLLIR